MTLSNYVAEFADQPLGAEGSIAGGRFAFKDVTTGISCHNAAFMWIYQAANDGALPPIGEIVGCMPFVNALLLRGHPSRVTAKTAPLAGDVLIFTSLASNAEARHTCIAKVGGNRGTIGGYNQQDWFKDSSGLIGGSYSEFPVSDINWTFRAFGPNQRAKVGGENFRIWAIRENTAIDLMRKWGK